MVCQQCTANMGGVGPSGGGNRRYRAQEEDMGVSHALEMWNIGASEGQRVEWRPRRTRFLDYLVDSSNRTVGWMAHGAGQEKKRTHELGHVLARIAAASSLEFPVASVAEWGALRVVMSSASSPTSLRRSSCANLRLTFARSTAST